MLQTVLPTKLFRQYEFQSMKSSRYTPTPSPNQSSSLNSSNALQKSPTITPFGKQERAPTQPSCPPLQQEGQETWPEIDSIVGKIRTLESTLKNQRKTTALLTQKIRQLEGNLATIEEERSRVAEQDGIRAAQASEWQQKYDEIQERMRELEQMITQKEAQLAQRQQLIENIQYGQLQKNSQYEARIRKLNTDAKELTDRLRKANMQAEKQRKSNQQLRSSMSSQLQQLQSQRDTFLLDEIERLKTLINSSKEEREVLLYEQIDELNRANYLQEQQIRKKDIELALAERKKHQAVTEIVEKKDQEIKVQKTLSKALNQKIAKLQEEIKSVKTQDLQRGLRRSHQRVKTHGNEDEVSFELSPEKL